MAIDLACKLTHLSGHSKQVILASKFHVLLKRRYSNEVVKTSNVLAKR